MINTQPPLESGTSGPSLTPEVAADTHRIITSPLELAPAVRPDAITAVETTAYGQGRIITSPLELAVLGESGISEDTARLMDELFEKGGAAKVSNGSDEAGPDRPESQNRKPRKSLRQLGRAAAQHLKIAMVPDSRFDNDITTGVKPAERNPEAMKDPSGISFGYAVNNEKYPGEENQDIVWHDQAIGLFGVVDARNGGAERSARWINFLDANYHSDPEGTINDSDIMKNGFHNAKWLDAGEAIGTKQKPPKRLDGAMIRLVPDLETNGGYLAYMVHGGKTRIFAHSDAHNQSFEITPDQIYDGQVITIKLLPGDRLVGVTDGIDIQDRDKFLDAMDMADPQHVADKMVALSGNGDNKAVLVVDVNDL